MRRHVVLPALTCFVAAAAVGLSACSEPTGTPHGSTPSLQAKEFAISPEERTCAATTPVGLGGPGIPPTYTVTFSVDIVNGTSDAVTITSVSTNGTVIAATDDVGVGRPAHVLANVFFNTTPPIAANTTRTVTGAFTLPCGDNPIMRRTVSWDIATTANIYTSKGVVTSNIAMFRRTWSPCDGGHPCPVTQPPLPSN